MENVNSEYENISQSIIKIDNQISVDIGKPNLEILFLNKEVPAWL